MGLQTPGSGSFLQITSAAVLPGNGDGTFGAYTTPIVAGYGITIQDLVQLVDLNNDGYLDLATKAGVVVITALNDGNGRFQAPTPTGIGQIDLAFADVNNDGYPDLIGDYFGTSVYPGNGDGTFGTPVASYAGVGYSFQGLTMADFNGDGIPDIAEVANDPRVVMIYAGLSGGKYSAAQQLLSNTTPVTSFSSLQLQATGDFSGDGYADVLTANGTSLSLESSLSDGKGGFSLKTALPYSAFPTFEYAQPVTADFNGDGLQDIILTGSVGTLAVALSKGDGTFGTRITIDMGSLGCELGYAATADLTGSGHQDLRRRRRLWLERPKRVRVFRHPQQRRWNVCSSQVLSVWH
jgi:FG-GAP-like repeat